MDLFIQNIQCHNATSPTRKTIKLNECTHENTQQTCGGIMCIKCGVVVAVRLHIDQSMPQHTTNTRKRNYASKNKQLSSVNPFNIFRPEFNVPMHILNEVRQLYDKISNDNDLLTLLRLDKSAFVCGMKAQAFVFVLIIKCCRSSLVNHTHANEQKWMKQSGISRKFASRFF